jgi:Protein of unknown function (DUF4231)
MANVVSRRAQEAFYLARWLVVIGATIVPTLVTAGAQSHGTVAMVAQVSAVVLSLLVALAAGALQVTRMEQRWRLFARLAGDLEDAGWKLLGRRNQYAGVDSAERFSAFVDHVQTTLLTFRGEYLARVAHLEGYSRRR